MQITKDSVVEFHYKVSEGEVLLEDSSTSVPLLYLHGHGGLFEKMEQAFVGKQKGDQFVVTF